jgi:hypothetical protein
MITMCLDANGSTDKVGTIQKAIDLKDSWKLRELALTEGGLVNGACRLFLEKNIQILSIHF